MHTRLINALLKSGVCDVLEKKETPISYQELSKITNVSEIGLHKILRYFSYFNIVSEEKTDFFSKSKYTFLFTKESKYYQIIEMFSSDLFYDIFRSVPESFLNGQTAIPQEFGVKDTWELFNGNTNYKKFKDSMSCITDAAIYDVIENVDFSDSKLIVDLGGSHGDLLEKIIEKYENTVGINFDLEKNHIIGSKEKPKNKKCFRIFHDWSDEECIKILNCISKSMEPGGRIYIFDYLLDSNHYDLDILWFDLKMFHYFNGQERSLEQYKKIFDACSFNIEKVYNFISGGILITKKNNK
ncbi:hypothetical protein DICPUDRAFT_87172 [Dictyostelium purpureum]|uniref:O-methyltransferase C-terminal domain-containing protein n=1 Tax=Dictyostelium purpureum TaxID=5786 RepID=F0ZGG6_DICPU|nr:uncharacterized protein DICPUDRAFT_87172 [Dictyostelium purpureum]EGC36939.1 hypothetical protein DICPUDRAFT_87172 [Dictyostelium purpureum]|eukprot:XP_003286507.1 hypothetical protein DICPUDRAFT_87172 [Dictyostelium purpureum]